MGEVQFDFSALKGRIVEKFGSCKAFAAAVNLPQSGVSARLNGTTPFRLNDVWEWSKPELLDIPGEDIPRYFFTPKVR